MDLADAAEQGHPRARSLDLSNISDSATTAEPSKDKQAAKKRKKRKVQDASDRTTAAPTPAKKAKATTCSTTADSAATVCPKEFCAANNISVQADDAAFLCPVPMTSFQSTPYAAPICTALKAAGYTAPTPTQAQSWPIALSGRDIISVARTGSGKTLGFLLPAFHALLNNAGGMKPRPGLPYIVALAPTRELACQISEEANKFGKAAGICTTTIYGEGNLLVSWLLAA